MSEADVVDHSGRVLSSGELEKEAEEEAKAVAKERRQLKRQLEKEAAAEAKLGEAKKQREAKENRQRRGKAPTAAEWENRQRLANTGVR
jgi:hypothetical protein